MSEKDLVGISMHIPNKVPLNLLGFDPDLFSMLYF
jgi:hypothetical protein